MDATAQAPQALEFRAEIQRLLNILAHSLYTDREIFLRELISNASDAINRFQFETLTQRDVVDPNAELAIWIEGDDQAKTVTIKDTGIGMTREELVENLGTIAHSGALAAIQNAQAEGKNLNDMIGQFGVGFYSVFMVADQVTVDSRSYRNEAAAYRWTSEGGNTYTLEPSQRQERGTTITLKLKEDAVEFASPWRLEQIVQRHSNFVTFPIYVKGAVANRQKALWRESPRDLQTDAYEEFYKFLTSDNDAPLAWVHVQADAPVQIAAILYVPAKREASILRAQGEYGPRLYSRRVMIQEHAKDLLPGYLRFVEGVVESDDIPLNISRETVQTNRALRTIQAQLVRRMLNELQRLADETPEKYATFWHEFGVFLKEGIATDPFGTDNLLKLLRFYSTQSGETELVSLATYSGRMPEPQKDIYYVLGSDLKSVSRSPHLDFFRSHKLEVLYFSDAIDNFMAPSLREFEGKTFRNIDDPDLELPKFEDEKKDESDATPPVELGNLIMRFNRTLGNRVTKVRESRLLTDSPVRLVSATSGSERDMQRIRRLLNETDETPQKILEVNPSHPLIRNLSSMVTTDADDPLIDLIAEQLYDSALVLEGMLTNPADMVPRIQQIMLRSVENKK